MVKSISYSKYFFVFLCLNCFPAIVLLCWRVCQTNSFVALDFAACLYNCLIPFRPLKAIWIYSITITPCRDVAWKNISDSSTLHFWNKAFQQRIAWNEKCVTENTQYGAAVSLNILGFIFDYLDETIDENIIFLNRNYCSFYSHIYQFKSNFTGVKNPFWEK